MQEKSEKQLRVEMAWGDIYHKRRQEEIAQLEKPVIKELKELGFDSLTSIMQLPIARGPRKEAVPVLIKHLKSDHSEIVRQSIARALRIKEARPYWNEIKEIFLSEKLDEEAKKETLKSTVGITLSEIASKEHFEDILNLYHDKSVGKVRFMFAKNLAKSPDKRATEALLALRDEPIVDEHPDDRRALEKMIEKQARLSKQHIARQK